MTLYLFAMDQRGWLERAIGSELPGRDEEVKALVRRAKALSFAGLSRVVGREVELEHAAVLVDEEFGTEVARQAKAAGITLSVPMERADCAVLELEYGDRVIDHVEALGPELPKLLIRHNVEGDRDGNDEQLRRLLAISQRLEGSGRRLLLELLVPPTTEQLQACGGEMRRYDEKVRPTLTIRAVDEIRRFGVSVDIWKIEGMYDRADAAAVGESCTSGASSTCLVLGRNAPWDDVECWLRNAATSPGYEGFAIGRTIWWDAVRAALAGALPEEEAIEQIASNYLRAVRCYEEAAAGALAPGEHLG